MNLKMSANHYNFSHANGTVKPKAVKSLEAPAKEPATKAATATKRFDGQEEVSVSLSTDLY